MSGQGNKRRMSPEVAEEPSAKRQRHHEPDTTGEASINEQSYRLYPTEFTQPSPFLHPQPNPSQNGFQPQPIPRPQQIPRPRPIDGANPSASRQDDEVTDADSVSKDRNVSEEGAGPNISSQATGKRRASSPASEEPESKRGPSARSQKRAGMERPGTDDKERGKVEEVGGRLVWRDPQTGELKKAVYHNDIRAELIAAASAHGEYTHERKRGTKDHDETSFLPEQRDWTPERRYWPRIRDNVLNMHTKADYKGTYYRQAVDGIWVHTDGRVILDKDNHPVRKFPDLPATLSSEIEGWYLEVLSRLDNRIQRRDVWARLPHGRAKTVFKPASEETFGLSALGNRRCRWRTSEGLIAWKSRVGSSEFNNLLKATIPQASLDRNSNEGGRSLTAAEIKHANSINEGKKVPKSKGRGRTSASEKVTTENAGGASSTPQSQPSRTLLPGYPDPALPSLAPQPRPLSTPLAGTEGPQEEGNVDDTVNNIDIDATNWYDFDVDPLLDFQTPIQPWETPGSGAGPTGAVFDNNIPELGAITENVVQDNGPQGWTREQQEWWDSLGNWDVNASNTVGVADATGQDEIPINQNGHHEWYQPDHGDAAESAKQTRHQIRQQLQGELVQIDNHASRGRSAAQSDVLTTTTTTTPPPTSTSAHPTPPVDPCDTIPTTRMQHAIIWRLLRPTRESFQAHFRDDDGWRPYVARDFVPVSDRPRSVMGVFDWLTGEFWRIWTARYGCEGVVVPALAPPAVDGEAERRLAGRGGS